MRSIARQRERYVSRFLLCVFYNIVELNACHPDRIEQETNFLHMNISIGFRETIQVCKRIQLLLICTLIECFYASLVDFPFSFFLDVLLKLQKEFVRNTFFVFYRVQCFFFIRTYLSVGAYKKMDHIQQPEVVA